MFLFLASCIAPLLLRIAQVSNSRGRMSLADLRGVTADLGSSFFVVLLIAIACARLRRSIAIPLALALLLAWALLNYGNFEHITALGAVADLSNAKYLFDDTFLEGSALHVSDYLLFALSLILPLTCFWLFLRSPSGRLSLTPPSLACVLCLVALPVIPINPEYTAWRQTNFAIENIVRFAVPTHSQQSDYRNVFGIYPEDLGGVPIVSLNHPGINVLLVIVEGISGATIDVVAKNQGLTGERPRLTSFDAKYTEAMTYLNFVNHQRQTNRGVYSLVCGDLPKLKTATPKMTEASLQKEGLFCLPEALRRNGYTTAFLQAAPLSFMGKDAFAAKAGFERFHGAEWFKGSQSMSAWGPNDKDFLNGSLQLMDELSSAGKPWFLTLLTSGTHHPFNVPESHKSPHEPHTFSHAVSFLDVALDEFIKGIGERKLFENTLILFTSDESFGLPGDLSNDQVMLNQAWGYLLAFLPSKEHGLVEQAFMQTDVALSVIDYLGMRVQAPRFRGRSVFRKYVPNRAVPFANTYLRTVGSFSDDGFVYMCDEELSSGCRRYQLASPKALYTELGTPTSVPEPPAFLRDIAERSLVLASATGGAGENKMRELFQTPADIQLPAAVLKERSLKKGQDLVQRGVEPKSYVATFKIFGDQYLSLAAGEKIQFDLEVDVSKDSAVSFFHTLKGVAFRDMPSGDEYLAAVDEQQLANAMNKDSLGARPAFSAKTQKLFGRTTAVAAGGKLRIRYSFGAVEPYQRLQFTLLAVGTEQKDALITIRTAQVSINRMDEKNKDQESGIHTEIIEPADGQIEHPTGYVDTKSIDL